MEKLRARLHDEDGLSSEEEKQPAEADPSEFNPFRSAMFLIDDLLYCLSTSRVHAPLCKLGCNERQSRLRHPSSAFQMSWCLFAHVLTPHVVTFIFFNRTHTTHTGRNAICARDAHADDRFIWVDQAKARSRATHTTANAVADHPTLRQQSVGPRR